MKINVLASGSAGNSYLLANDNGGDQIMIECGLSPKNLKKLLWDKEVYLSDINACLISHKHQDHSAAASYLANSTVAVCMSEHTADSIQDLRRDKLVILKPQKAYELGNWLFKPFESSHDDVPTLGFLLFHKPTGERVFYSTDTAYIRYQPQNIHYFMVEVNYQQKYLEETIEEEDMNRHNMRRVLKSHLALETALEFFEKVDTSEAKEIYVLHLSKRNANPDEVKQRIQEVTGVPVYIGGIKDAAN